MTMSPVAIAVGLATRTMIAGRIAAPVYTLTITSSAIGAKARAALEMPEQLNLLGPSPATESVPCTNCGRPITTITKENYIESEYRDDKGRCWSCARAGK